jgi:hypothetical protein
MAGGKPMETTGGIDTMDRTDLGAWSLADEVFLAGSGAETRIVDLARGQFYALDEVGARMLEVALYADEAELAARVASEYGVDVWEVERDWSELRGDLESRGLIGRNRVARPRVQHRGAWVRWTAALVRWCHDRPRVLITACWLGLRLLGLARTVALLRQCHGDGPAPAGEHDVAEILAGVDAAARDAAAGHILNPECKERALVAWQILRGRYGLPARLVVGIKTYPFQAHAWVESEGCCLTDEERLCRLFTPIAWYD